jgi:hypothetical protein
VASTGSAWRRDFLIMDTKLADAFAYWLYVAGIAERQAAHSASYLRLGPSVPQAGEPLGESPSLADFDHL